MVTVVAADTFRRIAELVEVKPVGLPCRAQLSTRGPALTVNPPPAAIELPEMAAFEIAWQVMSWSMVTAKPLLNPTSLTPGGTPPLQVAPALQLPVAWALMFAMFYLEKCARTAG